MTPAITQATRAGLEFTLHEFERGTGTDFGAQAVASLGLPPGRVFKTLIVALDRSRLATVVLPVACQLDLKRLAAEAGAGRATLAPRHRAERSTGYAIGGISPLGQRRKLPTFLDRSAFDFPTIYVSAGRRGLEIELSPAALQEVCDARLVSVAREERTA